MESFLLVYGFSVAVVMSIAIYFFKQAKKPLPSYKTSYKTYTYRYHQNKKEQNIFCFWAAFFLAFIPGINTFITFIYVVIIILFKVVDIIGWINKKVFK